MTQFTDAYKHPQAKRLKTYSQTRIVPNTLLSCICICAAEYDLWNPIMMTSSNGDIFRVTGPFWGNSPVTGEFPSQGSVTGSFDIFFDLCLNKRLSKQSSCRWFETPSRSLWRHCNWPVVPEDVSVSNTASSNISRSLEASNLGAVHDFI